MTAAGILLGIEPAVAAGLMLYLDVATCEMDTDEADAVFRRSRELVAGLTVNQRIRLSLIVHTLSPNKWMQ
jgi:hypothetical protein